MSTTTTRRTMLAALAATPVAAVPAMAADTSADAELIELGRQFERVNEAYNNALNRSHDAERVHGPWTEGTKAADQECFALCQDLLELGRAILAKRAHTLAGVMVKARMVDTCEGEAIVAAQAEGQAFGHDWMLYSIVRDLLRPGVVAA